MVSGIVRLVGCSCWRRCQSKKGFQSLETNDENELSSSTSAGRSTKDISRTAILHQGMSLILESNWLPVGRDSKLRREIDQQYPRLRRWGRQGMLSVPFLGPLHLRPLGCALQGLPTYLTSMIESARSVSAGRSPGYPRGILCGYQSRLRRSQERQTFDQIESETRETLARQKRVWSFDACMSWFSTHLDLEPKLRQS